jgi:hypothetical protein
VLGFDDSMPSRFTKPITDPNDEFNTILAVEGTFAVASRPIPEPGSAALFAMGAALVGAPARRQRI